VTTSNVFQYGANESNGRSMATDEQPQTSPGTGAVPPPRSGGRFDTPPDDTGGGFLTTRLVLMTVTIILLGTAAGLAGALLLPKTYGARAEVLYSVGREQGGDPLKQDRQLSTQLVLLKSPRLLGDIAKKQGRQFSDLDKEVSVLVLDNSNVIQVEATGTTKLAAMQTLQAVMDGYLALASQPTSTRRTVNCSGTRSTSSSSCTIMGRYPTDYELEPPLYLLRTTEEFLYRVRLPCSLFDHDS